MEENHALMQPSISVDPKKLRVDLPFALGEQVWLLDYRNAKIVQKTVAEYQIEYTPKGVELKIGVTKEKSIWNVFTGSSDWYSQKNLFATSEALIESLRAELLERSQEREPEPKKAD